jgi:ADP-ribosylglycohydrolase
MTAPAPAPSPDVAALAALPAIAVALHHGDASACDSAAAQLRDLITKAPADAAAAVRVAVAKHGDIVDAAFVQALGRQGLSDTAQHALVVAMMTILLHVDALEASTALMHASPVFLPILLRIIEQELPVSVCR